eukprot:CAMPEP_0172451008 /NCGR_PEP_ID=MMETSP1065-20121228/9181_1 /TAXON_ID=265537 /ORGANISM="Amphiprora paludosa, Strain CCMP125" /LENGTH=791 /DNA_ID=CAMNT_0013202889 /DNA_START=74 /DNA_END=2449 /DNA_ORIENTATION=-
MGKKKGKKVDLEKKAALQAKKEAKQDKATRKRLAKEARGGIDGDGDGDNEENAAFEALLQQYKASDWRAVELGQTQVVPLDTFPLARANATLTLNEDTKKKNAEMFLFGGEYYDGIENIVLDHLLVYSITKNEWKRINTPDPTPPPRCAHSTVYYNGGLYVFGGEMAAAEQYHHYKDLWRFDIKKQTWEEIKPPKASGTHPAARSGHTAVVWKHFMIIFGGFYEAMKDTSPRWYNDVCVIDLQTHLWLDIPHSKFASRPEPRSACNSAVLEDQDSLVIHGGFSKLSKGNSLARSHNSSSSSIADTNSDPIITSETKVHNDAWVLRLKPILSDKPPSWERLTSSVQRGAVGNQKSSPNGRAGTGSIRFKNRMLSFGGVVDAENFNHKFVSTFYADLFAFDLERRKWFPVHVKAAAEDVAGKTKRRRRKAEDDTLSEEVKNEEDVSEDDDDADLVEEEDSQYDTDTGWDLEKLRSNMFAFIDGDGNVVYERIDDSDDEAGKMEEEGEQEENDEEEKEEEKEDEETNKQSESKIIELPHKTKAAKPVVRQLEASSNEDIGQTVSSSSVMVVNPETQKPEAVTRSEPLPRINSMLAINGTTLYVYGGLLEVGDREVTLDDLWAFDLRKRSGWTCIWPGTMHKQIWRGAVHDDDDSYYSSNDKTTGEEEEEEEEDEFGDQEEKQADSVPERTSKKSGKRSEIRSQMNEIIREYGMSDEKNTPNPGESLSDFYTRTKDFWTEKAGGGRDAKDSKREGFGLAQQRYEELVTAIQQLQDLDRQYKEASAGKKDKKEKRN